MQWFKKDLTVLLPVDLHVSNYRNVSQDIVGLLTFRWTSMAIECNSPFPILFVPIYNNIPSHVYHSVLVLGVPPINPYVHNLLVSILPVSCSTPVKDCLSSSQQPRMCFKIHSRKPSWFIIMFQFQNNCLMCDPSTPIENHRNTKNKSKSSSSSLQNSKLMVKLGPLSSTIPFCQTFYTSSLTLGPCRCRCPSRSAPPAAWARHGARWHLSAASATLRPAAKLWASNFGPNWNGPIFFGFDGQRRSELI